MMRLTVLRLVIIPAVVPGLAVVLGLHGISCAALIPVFAAPNAADSFAMAQRMGGDAAPAGSIVIMTCLFCPLTIFAWGYLFRMMGVF